MGTVFSFDPARVKVWTKEVASKLNGSSPSVSGCVTKFKGQMDTLVQPGVWGGPAAKQNYLNFVDTQNAMIKFINDFGVAFEEAMKSVGSKVQKLEESNLGKSVSVSSTLGSAGYTKINNQIANTIGTAVVTYDYTRIMSIATALRGIKNELVTVNDSLKTLIKNITSRGWTGTAAENAKTLLSNSLSTNMEKVFENLNICIDNINGAAEAAQSSDK